MVDLFLDSTHSSRLLQNPAQARGETFYAPYICCGTAPTIFVGSKHLHINNGYYILIVFRIPHYFCDPATAISDGIFKHKILPACLRVESSALAVVRIDELSLVGISQLNLLLCSFKMHRSITTRIPALRAFSAASS